MKSTFLLILTLISLQSFGQDDLDEIFNDPKRDLSIRIGIDFVRTAYGTPNVSAEVVIKEKVGLQFELGFMPFGYKENFGDIERGVESGFEQAITANFLVWRPVSSDYWEFLIGAEFQHWDYVSSNLDVADDHDVKHVNSPFGSSKTFRYTLDQESKFRFKRKISGFGPRFGVNFIMFPQLSLGFGFHGSFSLQKMKFLEDQSFGVNWVEDAPLDWTSGFLGRSTLYARYSLTLKYHL